MGNDSNVTVNVGDDHKSVTGVTYSGSFTIKASDDARADSDDLDDLKEYLEKAMKNITVTSGRRMGKRMRASRSFGESVVGRLNNEYADVGDHMIKESEEGDGLRFECSTCDWSAVVSTDNWSDEELAELRLYIYGDALETTCVHPDSDTDDETETVEGIPVVTSDTSKDAIGYMAHDDTDDDTVTMVGYDPARQS